MKKNTHNLLLLLLALFTLVSCKKEEPNFNVGPKINIVFDDKIDKVTADYKIGSTLVLQVAAPGANTLAIVSNYNVNINGVNTPKRVNLGSFPVVNGVATVSIPANSLRATADGAPIGAGTAPVSLRVDNTYSLAVDATSNETTERRFFNAVLIR